MEDQHLILEQMEQTRGSLSRKLEMLEDNQDDASTEYSDVFRNRRPGQTGRRRSLFQR